MITAVPAGGRRVAPFFWYKGPKGALTVTQADSIKGRLKAFHAAGCLPDGSTKKDIDPEKHAVVEGVGLTFAFDRKALEEQREAYRAFLLEFVPSAFWVGDQDDGGGYSFVGLPFDRDERQWGEQPDADFLVAIAIGMKIGAYCLGREFWGVLPGGRPLRAVRAAGARPRTE